MIDLVHSGSQNCPNGELVGRNDTVHDLGSKHNDRSTKPMDFHRNAPTEKPTAYQAAVPVITLGIELTVRPTMGKECNS